MQSTTSLEIPVQFLSFLYIHGFSIIYGCISLRYVLNQQSRVLMYLKLHDDGLIVHFMFDFWLEYFIKCFVAFYLLVNKWSLLICLAFD